MSEGNKGVRTISASEPSITFRPMTTATFQSILKIIGFDHEPNPPRRNGPGNKSPSLRAFAPLRETIRRCRLWSPLRFLCYLLFHCLAAAIRPRSPICGCPPPSSLCISAPQRSLAVFPPFPFPSCPSCFNPPRLRHCARQSLLPPRPPTLLPRPRPPQSHLKCSKFIRFRNFYAWLKKSPCKTTACSVH